jgi:hypothetical protein
METPKERTNEKRNLDIIERLVSEINTNNNYLTMFPLTDDMGGLSRGGLIHKARGVVTIPLDNLIRLLFKLERNKTYILDAFDEAAVTGFARHGVRRLIDGFERYKLFYIENKSQLDNYAEIFNAETKKATGILYDIEREMNTSKIESMGQFDFLHGDLTKEDIYSAVERGRCNWYNDLYNDIEKYLNEVRRIGLQVTNITAPQPAQVTQPAATKLPEIDINTEIEQPEQLKKYEYDMLKALENYNFWKNINTKIEGRANIFKGVSEREFINMIDNADFSQINKKGISQRVRFNVVVLSRILGKEWGEEAIKKLGKTIDECSKRTEFKEYDELKSMYLQ